MIISFKMVDGSRIDVPANQYQKEKLIQDLSEDNDLCQWWQVCDENEKLIILRINNIVSITIKGDGDDSKTIP